MLPAHDLGDISFLFGLFDLSLGHVEHGKAGMGQDVLIVDFDEPFGGNDRLFMSSPVGQGHSQPMESVLVVWIDFQGFAIQVYGFVKLVVSKCFNSLLKNLFLCHDVSIAIEFLATMENIKTSTVNLGFLALPSNISREDPRPGLLVLQEWWGMNDHIKDITKRLANEGFAALAVDLYDGKVTKDPDEARGFMMSMDKAAALEKLYAGVRFLKNDPLVSNVGVIGFCMGGFWSLSLACSNRDVKAAVPFYGNIPPDPLLNQLRSPILYFYGEKDHHISASEIDRLENFMKTAGKAAEVVRYPESDHAFFNDTRKEVYNSKDAKDAWSRALAFLRKNLR